MEIKRSYTKGKTMRYRKKIWQAVVVSALVGSLTVVPVYAEPSDTVQELQGEQSDLEDQKSDAQSELNSLQTQLEGLLSKISELEDNLVQKGEEIRQAKADLAAAEERRQEQYDAMKLRIRYIYESGGDVAVFEKILSSGDITSMLTQAEYSQKVHEYDRRQLEEYARTVQEIEELEQTLETEMSDLQTLETQYQEQQDTLNATIASKQDEISDLDGMIQEAAARILEQQQREQEQQEAQAAADGQDDQNSSDDSGQSESNDTDGSDEGNTPDAPDYDTVVGGSVVSRAYRALGKPYEWSAAGPDSYDCSGLVSFALTGRYSHRWSTSDFITWPRVSNPQPGDVCIKPGHCGIYIGGGQMIHAPQTGDVVKISAVHSGMFYVRY